MAYKVTHLDGDAWELGHVRPGRGLDDVDKWHQASVPGNVRVDLLRNRLIEDPFIGLQNESSRWVEKFDWWYRREFHLDPKAGARTFLIMKGVDYECEVYVNGMIAAEHVGMFSPIIVDISRRVARENIIYVRIRNTGRLTDRAATTKCQMSFGWDFAPPIRAMGIWDSVSVVQCGDAFIPALHVDPIEVSDSYWEAHLSARINAATRGEAEVRYTIKPDNFASEQEIIRNELIVLEAGANLVRTSIPVDDPHLWQPWEEGPPHMYTVDMQIMRDDQVLHASAARFGLRSIELFWNENRPEHEWTFEINGKRKFIRGANWVPADSFPGCVDRARYQSLLQRARVANINMLRVWGGGLCEKQDFYDLCDDLGLLVWQEFPLACPNRPYPRFRGFRSLLRQEAKAIVHSCKNHPSVAMFCGGNELSQAWNRRILEDLERIVLLHGGGRPFKQASPTLGERHNWIVHHSKGNIAEYREETASILSEFGLQAPPVRESLEKFIPEENLWPVAPVMPYIIGEYAMDLADKVRMLDRFYPETPEARNARVWTYHHAQLSKIIRYAEQAGYENLDAFIDASQRMQALGLQVAVEHMRRRRYTASGVLFWQFNEPWPAICWSVLDYYGRPKLAYHTIRDVFNPLLVSLDYPLREYQQGDPFEAKAWIINDRHTEYHGLSVEINHVADGRVAAHTRIDVPVVAPDSGVLLDLPVAFEVDGSDSRLVECAVLQSEKVLSRNLYDLSLFDAGETPAAQKFAHQVMQKVFWS
jgi:beta-mannosidase